MADCGYMEMTLAGTAQGIEFGQDNTRREMGPGNSVEEMMEVLEFRAAVGVGSSRAADARATSARTWEPAEITLRHGKMTPLLLQALRNNERVDLKLQMFRRDHDTGETLPQTKFEIDQGRVVHFEIVNPNALNPETANLPPYVVIKVIPHTVRVIADAGTECEDSHGIG